MEVFDRRILDRSVHALDLAVGMLGLGRRLSMSAVAQVHSKRELGRVHPCDQRLDLSRFQLVTLGSVKCEPLSVNTVLIL